MGLKEALDRLPAGRLRSALSEAYDEGGDMAYELMQRGDMPQERALMVGLALDPGGRMMLERALNLETQWLEPLPNVWPEVVIGSGPHGATWATVQSQLGRPKSLVLEASDRFGGTFAMTQLSSFFLNSRNRPGPFGQAGSNDALNVIPGAPMQPSDLSVREYQANADLGLTVRCALAMNAMVRRATVETVMRQGDDWLVGTDRGTMRTRRVVVATGIGRPRELRSSPFDGKRVLSFEQFMQRFDGVFPLRGIGRVAVIGAGDSGKTVVEALAGYGPQSNGSVASLDYVPQIDWYGVADSVGTTKERWLECNRTRYKPLAALFPKAGEDVMFTNARVRPLQYGKSSLRTFESVQVNGQFYDTVIVCKGYELRNWPEVIGMERPPIMTYAYSAPERDDSARLGLVSNGSVVVVGPAANIPFDNIFIDPIQTDENRVALFRLIPRTAALAQMLPPA